jgi:hypothetical protein
LPTRSNLELQTSHDDGDRERLSNDLTIDTQDEDVRIAAAALKDMREGNPLIDPTNTASASFAAPRHERSHPSHSPSRRKQSSRAVYFSFQLSLNFSDFYIKQSRNPATPSLLSIASSATSNSFDTPQIAGVDRSTTPNSVYSQSPAHRFDRHLNRLSFKL